MFDDFAAEKGASSCLTVILVKEMDLNLNKREFKDAVHRRYDWQLSDVPNVCVCGERALLMAHKQQAIATTLCKELQASNCVYKSQDTPATGIGPPPVWLEKLLTSIALRLTLPKLHLATFKTFNSKLKN